MLESSHDIADHVVGSRCASRDADATAFLKPAVFDFSRGLDRVRPDSRRSTSLGQPSRVRRLVASYNNQDVNALRQRGRRLVATLGLRTRRVERADLNGALAKPLLQRVGEVRERLGALRRLRDDGYPAPSWRDFGVWRFRRKSSPACPGKNPADFRMCPFSVHDDFEPLSRKASRLLLGATHNRARRVDELARDGRSQPRRPLQLRVR